MFVRPRVVDVCAMLSEQAGYGTSSLIIITASMSQDIYYILMEKKKSLLLIRLKQTCFVLFFFISRACDLCTMYNVPYSPRL